MSVMRSLFPADPTHPVGLAIIGTGYWGRNYVRILEELSDSNVHVVCDAFVDRLHAIGQLFPNIELTTSIETALDHPGVEAAIVCTPAATHRAVAEQCLARGVHVLVEKPLTTTVDDSTALIELADAEELILMTGHTFLFNSGVRKLKEYVDNGEIGRVYYLHARRTSLGPIRSDVNALWDLAPHDISIFNYVLGSQPEWVSAIGGCALRDTLEDVGFISLGYPGGIVAHVHVSWAEPFKTREVVVVGSDKRVVFNDTDALERVRVFEKGVAPAPGEASTFGEFQFLLRDGDIVSPMIPPSEPLKEQCAHFLRTVRGVEVPLTDGRLGRDVVSVMEAIDRSVAACGAPIRIDSLEPVGVKEDATHAASLR
jgi:predicted dehydrogenase